MVQKFISVLLLGIISNLCFASGSSTPLTFGKPRPMPLFGQPSYGHPKHFEENELHKKIYQEILKEKPNVNTIFSPFSIQLCMALAHKGAHGKTADEMSELIGYSSTFNYNNFSTMLDHLKQQDALKVANKVYIKTGFALRPEYETSVRDVLKSDVESIDFGNKAGAAKTISDWIEEQTNHKIKDMVKQDMITELSRFMLVNAVYFKANWAKPFPNSFQKSFTNSDSTVNDVDMMQLEDYFKVGRISSAYVIQLPYLSKMAMYLVIPDDVQGLTNIEQHLHELNFHAIPSTSPKRVRLQVPAFKFELDLDLKKILKRLGVVAAFDDHDADFSGMLMSQEQLKISDAIHKAFIAVDKKGTEAGAATVFHGAATYSLPPRPDLVLTADHPFMFAIVSEEYNVPLFMGSVKHL